MITSSQPVPVAGERTEEDRSIDAVIERLAAVRETAPYVVSCYIALTPEDRENQKYILAVKPRLTRARTDNAAAALPHAERMALLRDLDRILESVSRPAFLPHARGVAIFASEPIGLYESVPLPRVHRTRVIVDRTPLIGELVASAAEFGRVLVVVVDRAHARFFEVSAAGAVEREDLWDPNSRGGRFRGDRRDAPGFGERRYHNRIREELHRHYADVIHRLEQLVRQEPTRGIIFAGPDVHTAALPPFLSQSMSRLLLGTVCVNPMAVSAAELELAALDVADRHDREEIAAAVAAWREALGKDWAVDGPVATLLALGKGQARRIFVRGDLVVGGYRCEDTGRLAVSESDCQGEGAAVPISDLVDNVIEEAVRQGIELVIVDEAAVAGQFDRLAATLRFREH
ncbi:MAG: hypothetical protein ACREL5_09810 [Gemmatimonadales bacterium]